MQVGKFFLINTGKTLDFYLSWTNKIFDLVKYIFISKRSCAHCKNKFAKRA